MPSSEALRRFLPPAILLLGAGGLAALVMSKPAHEPLGARERAWVVQVESARPGIRAPQLTLYGLVESPRTARISAAINAEVREVRALSGQSIDAGALLVQLDDREVALIVAEREAEVAEIEAQIETEARRHENDLRALGHEQRLLELARKEVERAENLARSAMGSASQLDQLRQQQERQELAITSRGTAIQDYPSRQQQLAARLDRARALRDRALLDLERARLRAPFEGRVSEVAVSPGDRVRPGEVLLTVHDNRAMEIRAQVALRHLPVLREHLAAGRELGASARVDGIPLKGVLARLAARVAPGSGAADAYFRVLEGGEGLPLGRVVELLLDLPPEPGVVALPHEAIYGIGRIYLVEDGRLRGLRVERVGERRDPDGSSQLLVRSPELGTTARVVVTQLPNAMDGLRVRIAAE